MPDELNPVAPESFLVTASRLMEYATLTNIFD